MSYWVSDIPFLKVEKRNVNRRVLLTAHGRMFCCASVWIWVFVWYLWYKNGLMTCRPSHMNGFTRLRLVLTRGKKELGNVLFPNLQSISIVHVLLVILIRDSSSLSTYWVLSFVQYCLGFLLSSYDSVWLHFHVSPFCCPCPSWPSFVILSFSWDSCVLSSIVLLSRNVLVVPLS